jgi:hypothetical protein
LHKKLLSGRFGISGHKNRKNKGLKRKAPQRIAACWGRSIRGLHKIQEETRRLCLGVLLFGDFHFIMQLKKYEEIEQWQPS